MLTGIGKLIAAEAEYAEVEFFDSLGIRD